MFKKGLFILLFSFYSLLNAATTPIHDRPLVLLDTSYGPISLRLFVDEAPLASENFLQYVRDGFYDNTLIHKVVDGFIIQMGGFDADLKPKDHRKPIRNESRNGIANTRGTVALALTTDANSGASQFFINLADNDDLNYSTKKGRGFTVFAEVIDGMEIVDKIKKVRTKRLTIYSELYDRHVPMYNIPEFDIVIKNASILRDVRQVNP